GTACLGPSVHRERGYLSKTDMGTEVTTASQNHSEQPKNHCTLKAHLAGLPCPIRSQPWLLPLFYWPGGWSSIGGHIGHVHQTFRRSTSGLPRMTCGLFRLIIIGGSWYGCAAACR